MKGEMMSDNAEAFSRAIDDFTKLQRRMLLAREEKAVKAYADLKEDYVSRKLLLTSLGVHLTAIDKSNE